MLCSIKYTNDMPAWMNGRAIGPFIQIRPAYKDDKPLLIHEMTHVRQFWQWGLLTTFLLLILTMAMGLDPFFWGLAVIGMGLHPLLYRISSGLRYEFELEAYDAQVQAGADLETVVRNIIRPEYGYAVSAEQAREDLLLH